MANKRISRHRLLIDHQIKGNLRGLLERGIQESPDREEEFDPTLEVVIALAVSPHSFPFIRLQHAQLNNDPYFSSHEITRQEDEHKIRQ